MTLATAESLHPAELADLHVRPGKSQKAHVKRKRGVFRCDNCTSVFGLRHNLLRHQRTIHERHRPFKCTAPGCAAAFVQRFDLQTHAASVHDKRKDFWCAVCARAFSQRSNLATHLRAAHDAVLEEAGHVVDAANKGAAPPPARQPRNVAPPATKRRRAPQPPRRHPVQNAPDSLDAPHKALVRRAAPPKPQPAAAAAPAPPDGVRGAACFAGAGSAPAAAAHVTEGHA